jgi:hypothetical protein
MRIARVLGREASPDRSDAGVGQVVSIAALSVPLLYLLLLGPAVRFYQSLPPEAQKALEVAYAPLEWLDEKVPGRPISKYAEWWRPND